MFQHIVYKCPKCLIILLVSNKMLHDLRCTRENPATYENILYQQNQQIENENKKNRCPNTVQRLSHRLSITNEDGTMIDIKKEKNMRGQEEFVETKYDKEGNILSRKKADLSGFNMNPNSMEDSSEYNEYDDSRFEENYDNNNNTYYQTNVIETPPNIIYETIAPKEIVYTVPAKYVQQVTINKPIEETIISSDTTIPDAALNDAIIYSMISLLYL